MLKVDKSFKWANGVVFMIFQCGSVKGSNIQFSQLSFRARCPHIRVFLVTTIILVVLHISHNKLYSTTCHRWHLSNQHIYINGNHFYTNEHSIYSSMTIPTRVQTCISQLTFRSKISMSCPPPSPFVPWSCLNNNNYDGHTTPLHYIFASMVKSICL